MNARQIIEAESPKRIIQQHSHEAAHIANVRRVNDWADAYGVKCTCGARKMEQAAGMPLNHSSTCAVFKAYYKNWKPPRQEAESPKAVFRQVATPENRIAGMKFHSKDEVNKGTPVRE